MAATSTTCSICWAATWRRWRRRRSCAWSYGWQRLIRAFEQYNPIGKAQRNVAHHYDLNGPALRLLPRPRPAVFLRLLQDRRRAAGAGAARQEAPHRREAAAEARPEGARHRLGLGRHGACSSASSIGVDVTGVTLSKEQLAVSSRRALEGGMADRVRFKLLDYRQEPGTLRPHRLGRHVRACRRRPLRRVLHAR